MTMETQIYWAVMSGDELTENYLVWSKTLRKYIGSNELIDNKVTVFLELPRSLVQDDMYYWTKPCPRCTKPLTDLNVAIGCKGCGYILASG
jgi:hypothetical protein